MRVAYPMRILKPLFTILLSLSVAGAVARPPKGFPQKSKTIATEETEISEKVVEDPATEPTKPENTKPKKKLRFLTFGKKKDPPIDPEAAGPEFHFPKSAGGVDLAVKQSDAHPDDPWQHLWNSTEFKRAFTGRYGFHPAVEPELTDTNELAFMRELAPLLGSDKKLAAYVLKTNVTAESNPQLDFTLGSLYFELGDFETAARHYTTAIDKFPDFRRAQKNLGFCRLKLGQFEQAAVPLARAIELGDRDSVTYGLLGFCHFSGARHIPAEAAYRQAILFQPDNREWRLGLVKTLVVQEKLAEANRLVDEVLGRDPTADDMWVLQAGIYARMENPGLAAVNYEIVRKLGKATPKLLFALGDIYLGQESGDLALPIYQEAIAKSGGADVKRSLRTAKILVSRSALADAKNLFGAIRTAAAGKLGNDDELELLKLEAKVLVAEGDSTGAVNLLGQVVGRDPLDGEALILIGEHHLRLVDQSEGATRHDHFAKAENRFDLASKISGFKADALVKLAQLRVKQEKLDAAITLLNKAQKIDPRDSVQSYLEAIERIRRTAGT